MATTIAPFQDAAGWERALMPQGRARETQRQYRSPSGSAEST
jgi:hypothetical protein